MTDFLPVCFFPVVCSVVYVLLMIYATWWRERRWARGVYGLTEQAEGDDGN